jgi:hypothetical protein
VDAITGGETAPRGGPGGSYLVSARMWPGSYVSEVTAGTTLGSTSAVAVDPDGSQSRRCCADRIDGEVVTDVLDAYGGLVQGRSQSSEGESARLERRKGLAATSELGIHALRLLPLQKACWV